MTIHIRAMQISDYEQALDLWQHTAGMGLSSADEKREIARFLQQNQGLCFVALEDEHLIGTILCGEDGRRGYLYHLAVQQNKQKKGVGKSLLQKSLNALKEKGIQKCHLFVIADNLSGIAFWEHVGWEMRDDIEIMSINLE
ncbi:MAG TPA: GNAT family N-acetyltransferase [Anaerolineaceae bacterium]|nr:GNAT family N-acetyltransferase [Anaerolineaceae bacterium]